MKVWITHNSRFGNGERVANQFGEIFSDWEVKISHNMKVTPKEVIEDEPDLLIIGTAVRMFMVNSDTKKWVRKLHKELKRRDMKIPFVAIFSTHMLQEHKIRPKLDRFYKLVDNSETIINLYPQYFLAQVEDIEGPLKPGVLDYIAEQATKLQYWIEANQTIIV